MKNVLIISIENINNAGDEILRATTQYIVELCSSVSVQQMQFFPKKSDVTPKYGIDFFIGNIFKWLSYRFKGKDLEYKLRYLCYRIQFTRYFSSYIKKSDKIIFAVGMLKYSTQNCSYFFDIINGLAEKYNKPVMMSAMSIESPDINDWRCRRLIDSVNKSVVNIVTTRDGEEGLNLLRNQYIKRNGIYTDFVGDPALWIPECYDVHPSFGGNDHKIIGIGLVRSKIFEDYSAKNISESVMLQVYGDIIHECENRGYEWRLFCNGIKSDYHFGELLISHFGFSDDKLLPPPHSGRELIDIVSQFDCIFGARLHACITAFALGVPVAGLIWDNKLRCFAKTMNIYDYFSEPDEFVADKVVDKIELAMTGAYDDVLIHEYRNKTKQTLKNYVEQV